MRRVPIHAAAWGVAALALSGPFDARAVGSDAAVPPAAAEPRRAGDGAETRFALVWHNASFFTAPNRKARRARAFDYRSSEREARLDWVWPVKVMSTDAGSGFVEIETPGTLDRNTHCYHELKPAAGMRLRLFVHESDLALVTTRETRARRIPFPTGIPEWKATARLDSTGDIVLAPGVALLPHGPRQRGEFMASLDNVTFAVAIGRDGDVGQAYLPARRTAPAFSSDRIGLRMGSKDLFRRTAVYDRRKVGEETRGTIRERCMETDLPLPPGRPRADPMEGMLKLLGPAEKRQFPVGEVRAGARAHWPDGALAGTVDEGRSFTSSAPDAGKRRCFQVVIRDGWPKSQAPRDEDFLPLCFDPEDVTPDAAKAFEEPASKVPVGRIR